MLTSRSFLRTLLSVVLPCCLALVADAQQYKLRGVVTDGVTGETLPGANVGLKGTTVRTIADIDGRFELLVNELPPYTLIVSFVGFATQEVVVQSIDQELRLKLGVDQVLLKDADVVGSRITEKQKQAPLTVESMDVIAIREAPSGDFYESLGTLKGVDMTAASMGFKVINTRGFNSTSPVRSLQLIDGVDNQSPGLNFSLGNFLGASDLDVMKVDVIAGASTAFYGPGAFNGVINMTSKSPWLFPGLSVTAKVGERDLLDGAVRWAQVFKNSAGKDRFAYKLNLCAMKATDWFAEDYSATSNSPTVAGNPGRYDGVNIYGDENTTVNNNFSRDVFSRINYPGLGTYMRPGYKESDLVDYGTDNLKAGVSLHYKVADSVEVVAASNYSRGSTVYQGENRYRLENVQFFQHRLEVRKEGTWFLRGYVTHEDAGNTYDIFTTGVRLQEAGGSTQEWNNEYYTLWETWIKPRINVIDPSFITIQEAPGAGSPPRAPTMPTSNNTSRTTTRCSLDSIRTWWIPLPNWTTAISTPRTSWVRTASATSSMRSVANASPKAVRCSTIAACSRTAWVSTGSNLPSVRSSSVAATANICPTARERSSAIRAMWSSRTVNSVYTWALKRS
ncbi:MAG: carboxypeptidase-like regulatory domain-containing protein [Flavobacteriales bacterium]|nr:carboxypeptidase-like regulatory domain-containing protein [Flavobacteriales bacterium]